MNNDSVTQLFDAIDKMKEYDEPEIRELTDSMFYTEILDSLNLKNVSYWFAGHTHECASIKHGNTNVIINPYGTPHEQNHRQSKLSTEVHLL